MLLHRQDHHISFVIIFAEKPLERLCPSSRGKDSRIHGPWWSVNTDCLCSPGWSQRSWLHACQTVWLPLQCVHTQLPLLWQERGWEDGYGQNNRGAQLFFCSFAWVCWYGTSCLSGSAKVVVVFLSLFPVCVFMSMFKCTWQWECVLFCIHRQTKIH